MASRFTSYGSIAGSGAGAGNGSAAGEGGYQSLLADDPTSHAPPAGVKAPADSAPSDDEKPLLSVPRAVMLDVLEKRKYRAAQCRSVPASVFFYCIYIAALLTHVLIGPGYDFEQSLLTGVVGAGDYGFYVTTPADWYYWMQNSLLPYALVDVENNGQLYRGYYGQYALLVGGIRLVQTRSANTSCPLLTSSQLQTLYGKQCHPFNTLSSVSDWGNMTAAGELGVAGAFTPASLQWGERGPEFSWLLNVADDLSTNQYYVQSLADSYWLDDATRDVRTQMVLLNGEIGALARIEFTATFTRGSRVNTEATLISMPLDPYGAGRGWLWVFDIVVLAYWAYLVLGTARRIFTACRRASGCGGKIGSIFNYFRLLDLANSISFLVVIIAWAETCISLNNLRKTIDDSVNADVDLPTDFQGRVFEATQIFRVFKVAATVTLILLSLRLFKYLRFQPRLNVLVEVFSRTMVDAAHFCVLVALLLVCFGVWGHFLFGTQSFDWSSPGNAAFYMIKWVMYDYDLYAMEQQYLGMAHFFYIIVSLFLVNFLVWSLLAVVMDVQAQVRFESHQAPTMWEEASAFVATLPYTLACCSCCRPRRRGLLTLHDLTWGEIIDKLQTDVALRASESVTPGPLSMALRISQDSADRLIADVIATSRVIATPIEDEDEAGATEARAQALYGALSPTVISDTVEAGGAAAAASKRDGAHIARASSNARFARAMASLPAAMQPPIVRHTLSRGMLIDTAVTVPSADGEASETSRTVRELREMVAALTGQVAALSAAITAGGVSRGDSSVTGVQLVGMSAGGAAVAAPAPA